MYRMLTDYEVASFRAQREAGIARPIMPQGKVPKGAFDTMTPQLRKALVRDQASALPASAKKALDAMSAPTQKAIIQHLNRDRGLARDTDDPFEPDQDNGNGDDLREQIVNLLGRAGLHDDVIERVLELLAGQQGANDSVIGTKKAYDQEEAGPPPFPGKPEVGKGPPPTGERAEMLKAMSRIQGEAPPAAYSDGVPVHDAHFTRPSRTRNTTAMNARRCSGRDARFIARPPHRTVRAACPHTAPTLGV